MSPGSGVGRGMSAIDRTLKPCASSRARYSSSRLDAAFVHALARERPAQRDHDARDAAASAELAHEAPAGSERAPHAGDDPVGLRHPVHGRVAEHGVELAVERELLPVRDARVEATPAGGFDLRRARIDADHRAAARDERLREHSVAAAEVENALPRHRREQLDDRRAQLGDEARGACVALGIPALGYGRASSTRLKGVSVARRKRVKPPAVTTSRSRASPACAPSPNPTSCASEAGVQTMVEAA